MRRLNKYGLTQEQFDRLFAEQEGKCAICSHELVPVGVGSGVRKDIAVVDHKGSKVRGILCSRYNVGIGMLRDDIDILCAAIEYLSRSER